MTMEQCMGRQQPLNDKVKKRKLVMYMHGMVHVYPCFKFYFLLFKAVYYHKFPTKFFWNEDS